MFDHGKSGKPQNGPENGPEKGKARRIRRKRLAQLRQGFYDDRLARAIGPVLDTAVALSRRAAELARQFVFSLSGQLLFLTFGFVMIVEAVIIIPSLSNDQERWLNDRIRRAEIASQAVDTSTKNTVSKRMSSQLLNSAGVLYLAIQNDGVRDYRLFDPDVVVPDQVMDLRDTHKDLVHDILYLWAPWKTLLSPPGRLLHVQNQPRVRSGQLIEIVVPAAPLRATLRASLLSKLRVSLSISLAAGVLVFAALSGFIVRPIRRLTKAIQRFKANPEDLALMTAPTWRQDEIGQIERELLSMQEEVRNALRSRARLAALGQAVSKINHDLRNMLTSAQMASDRLSAASSDPTVAKALPRLERALDRALSLATNVLTYGKSDEHAPQIQIVNLKDLAEAAAEDAGLAVTAQAPEPVRFTLKASKGFHLEAD
ncbi:MAG: HAMP domain-containing histidine kinase, partial [Asticcacaulis sp.]|nr:HAMP domain-containing histidine kinase [Asticcacaulis sp.]